ncbi:MAG: hypothetical protein ABIZ49_12705 [Opitutaceae bacterium]
MHSHFFGRQTNLIRLALFAAATFAVTGYSARLTAADVPATPAPTPAVPPKPDHVPLDLFTLPDDLEITLWAKAPLPRNPSAEIALGFEGSEITLQDGTIVNGRVLSNGDPLIVQSMGGLTQLIPAAKLAQPPNAGPAGRGGRPLGRSLMLSAEQLGLSAQDVADIVAYLKTQ